MKDILESILAGVGLILAVLGLIIFLIATVFLFPAILIYQLLSDEE